MDAELAHVREALARSEDGRVAAEARLPEIDVLQAQLAAAAEELAEAKYAAEGAAGEAEAKQAAAAQAVAGLEAQLQVGAAEKAAGFHVDCIIARVQARGTGICINSGIVKPE